MIWKKEISLDILKTRNKNTLVEHLEIEFTEIGVDFLSAKMPVKDQVKQAIGIMHGGASCVLAETVGSNAANFAVDNNNYCVGLDINTSHISSIKEDYVFAKAEPIHIGRSTHIWKINIEDNKGKLISYTRLTMLVMQKNL